MVDFAIVGGGPAGLAVAIEACRAGRSAVVIERGTGPIDKACGEGIMPQGVARLHALGVQVDPDETHPFRGIRYVDGDQVAEASFLEGPGLGVRRTALAQALRARVQALGGEIWETTEARSFMQRSEHVSLVTSRGELEARWLVAADGLHSRIRADAGFAVTWGSRRRFGMRRHFHVKPWSPFVEVHWADGVEAYVTPVGPERVGVAFLWRGERGDYDGFLDRFPTLRARLGSPETERRGAGPFDVRVDRQSRGRVLLAGDAAGYVDALTGEGVALSLLGAQALVSLVTEDRAEAWSATWRSITRHHRQLTRLLLLVADRPWLRRRVVRAFARYPEGFQALLALNTGAFGWGRAMPGLGQLGVGLIRG